VAAIFLYSIVHEYFKDGVLISDHFQLLTIFILIAVIEYVYAHKLSQYSRSNSERVWFRIVTNLIDNILLAVTIIHMGKTGTPLFVVYLWITFGIGIRYGGLYLIFSAILNFLSFSAVIMVDPVWISDDVIYITIGILLSFIILPAYVYVLISKLAIALESEKAASQAKQSLLAYMNHELRTPLNSILNLSELIRTYELPIKIYSMLDIIRASVISQLQIVNSMLDISKLEIGQYNLDLCKFDLYTTLRDVRQLLLPEAHKKGVNFYLFIDPTCERYVTGAVDQIKQILINLVSNAVKFTEKGHVRLSVTSGKTTKLEQELVFEIIDTGIGIAEESQKEIFQPFVQADTSITKKYGGTGLGLAISSELAKLMGGHMMLESSIEKGTKITFKCEFKIDNADWPCVSDNLTIQFMSQEEGGMHYVDFYRENGFNVLLTYLDQGIINESKNIEAGRIIFINNKLHVNEAWLFDNEVNEKNISIIEVLGDEDSHVNNLNAVAAINNKTSSKALLNALVIGEIFLPQKKYLINRLPRIDRVLNILLAEDDPTLREIHKIIFGLSGHKVTLVKDGSDALNKLLQTNYDVVILDNHMPDYSGIEVAQSYRKLKPKSNEKIVLLTADVESAVSSYDDTFILKLVKPIESGNLLRSIYRLFDSPDPIKDKKDINYSEIVDDNCDDLGDGVAQSQSSIQIIDWFGPKYSSELLNIYREEMDELISELSASQLPEDYSKILRILHKMQGVSLSLGDTELGNSISSMLKSKIEYQPNNLITKSQIDNLVNKHDKFMEKMAKYLIN